MPKSQPRLKAEKREAVAKKIIIKKKKGATLAGQLARFQTAGKYMRKKQRIKI
ncbi:MAG TPA: hypothetical protein PLR18_02250 [bacterium]|nr:hypothetical protein [bacterium]